MTVWNDSSARPYGPCGLPFLQFPAHNIIISAVNSHLLSDAAKAEPCFQYPVTHDVSLNVYRGIRGKNKACNEAAEIAGASGEYTQLVQLARFAN